MTNRWRRWLGAGIAAVAIAADVWSCSSNDNPAAPGGTGVATTPDRCNPPQEGCPCTSSGEERECGKVKVKYDDYVACELGKQRCEKGSWGQCKGDSVAYKSIRPLGGALHTLALGDAGACVGLNLCEPSCFSYENDNSKGFDAGPDSALVATDAGGFVLQGKVQLCTGLQCAVATNCLPGNETRITGIVRDPAGLNPVNNALVYIPNNAAAALPTIPDGAQPDTCGGAGTLPVSVAYAFTGPDGRFTMTGVPNGVPMRIVIQTGKWRRDFMYTIPTACTATDFEATAAQKDLMRLPRTENRAGVGEGHIPKLAIVNSGCENIACMIRRLGIADSEFGNYSQAGGTNIPTVGAVPYINRRIHLFRANGGTAAFGANTVNTPPRSELLGIPPTVNTTNPARVRGYDIVFLPCDCGSEYGTSPAAERQSLADYLGVGGRAMASHWGREWIENAPAASQLPTTATWIGSGSSDFYGYPFTGAANPGGATFKTWMNNVGALTSGAYFVSSPGTGRQDVSAVNAATSRMWVYESFTASATPPAPPPAAPSLVADYTFDTPIGAGPKYGRMMFTSMHLSDPSGSEGGNFPASCSATPALAPQEKAMEYLLNDLGACVNNLPPGGVLYTTPATFRREFTATCPGSFRPVWHLFQWQSVTQGDSKIVFNASTSVTIPGLDTAVPVTIATAQGAPTAGWVGVDVETKLKAAAQYSQPYLRVDMTLTPSTDQLYSPSLLAWRVGFSCESAE